MAIANQGPLGPFKGKLGPIHGYIRNGKPIISAFPRVVRPRTEKQKAVLQRMQVLSPFFNLISPYLAIGFELSAIKNDNSANNSAKSYNLKNAIKGEYPDQELDYPKIRLTEGMLPIAENAHVTAVQNGLQFNWTYDQSNQLDNSDDKTMLLAFFPDEKIRFYMISGVERKQCQQILEIDPMMKGQEAETYISFITDDRKAISNSVYTGKVAF